MARRRRPAAFALALALAALALGGCQPQTPAATSASVAPPSPVADAPPTSAEREAMRLRTEIGFQADLAYIRAVASDPQASVYLGIPLLPAEIDELKNRAASLEAVQGIVQAEADAAPNDFCGLYIDNQNAGALTSMWRANRLQHELAIRAQIQPTARIAFRDCAFSEEELDHVMDLLNEADRAWMGAIPAVATSWGTSTSGNRIEMEISSVVPGAADAVRTHYEDALGLPPGMLVVHSDGNGAALRPWGTVLVKVVGKDGKPIGENNLGLSWEGDLSNLYCGVGDVGFGIWADGKATELPCQEGVWTISVTGCDLPDEESVVFGTGTVRVRGKETAKLTIRLMRNPPSPPC